MGKFSRLLAEYDAETTTWSACVGAAQTSPFQCDIAGRLVGIRICPSRTAATTLLDHVQFRLTCTQWSPNTIHVGVSGSGLQTAPAIQPTPVDWPVDLPVNNGSLITVEGRNILANAVTVDILVYGIFETQG